MYAVGIILLCFYIILLFFARTKEDIRVLEPYEIHPTRNTFIAELGEGAFGKVHLATHKAGLEYFNNRQIMRQKLVAVKELHGK